MRLVAFVFIVALHSRNAEVPLASYYNEPLTVLPRFGVPFFFLVSGYFLKLDQGSVWSLVVKFLKRLLPIYIFWVLVYLVIYRLFHHDFGTGSPRGLIFEGRPGYHLWFLPSLGVSVVLAIALMRFLHIRYALLVCLALYAIGLYFSELHAPFGPSHVLWNFRDGPFFGTIFVVLGNLARRQNWQPTLATAIGLFTGGLVLLGLERLAVVEFLKTDLTVAADISVGTLFYGTGALALALALPNSLRIVHGMASLGRFTLGFYCIHLLFLWPFQWYLPPSNIANVLIAVTAASVLSIAAVLALSKIAIFRRLIS